MRKCDSPTRPRPFQTVSRDHYPLWCGQNRPDWGFVYKPHPRKCEMAEAIRSNYGQNQSGSKPTTDSDSSDDEYPPDPDSSSTTSASGRSIKLDYTYEVKWLKRNKNISRQERRRIQQEIKKGRKPGEPMTSLLCSFTLRAIKEGLVPTTNYAD